MRRALFAIMLGSVTAVATPACARARQAPLPPAQLKQLFHVSLAYPEPADDRTAVTMSGPSGPETLYVKSEEVFSLAQVQDVRSRNVDGNRVLAFLLNADGKSRMASASSSHVGGRMAVFVEGKVHSAPVVRDPILNGEFYLSGGYSDDQMRALEGKLRWALGYR